MRKDIKKFIVEMFEAAGFKMYSPYEELPAGDWAIHEMGWRSEWGS